MKYKRIPPSDVKCLTDKDTGTKYSQRDCSFISSMVNPAASLLGFGEEIRDKWQGKGKLFYSYVNPDKGKGYIVYSIESDKICVCDVFSDCISSKENDICFEALVEAVGNLCKALNKAMCVDTNSESFGLFIATVNQIYKEQKIEDKYWWTKQ